MLSDAVLEAASNAEESTKTFKLPSRQAANSLYAG
jgi:hypothetical protein